MKPFDIIGDLSDKKSDMIRNSENPALAEKIYSAFLTNRSFSFHADTVMHANEMNCNYGLENLLQHDYYMKAVPRRRRFGWVKKTDEVIDQYAEKYSLSVNEAKEHARVLGLEKLRELLTVDTTGGVKKHGSRK